MNKEIFELLCCPDTKQPVSELDAESVKALNNAIGKGNLKNVGDKIVKERMDTALVREDGKIAYPVRNNIPIMLIHEGFDPTQR